MFDQYFAHTLEGRPQAEWQGLQEHLEAVAERASQFAASFGAADWAHRAGLWHDLGKYSEAFQNYLRVVTEPDPHRAEVAKRVDHSTAGAQRAAAKYPVLGHLLAFVIAGHHSGLLDAQASSASLEKRLDKKDLEPIDPPPALDDLDPPSLPAFLQTSRDAFAIAFFTRMLFSCLVDADFLDTEAFMNPDQGALRPQWPEDILQRMAETLDAHMAAFKAEDTEVNRQRAAVRRACLDAASEEPGLFSLTVPTGGGKTLSSLAFALRHAMQHKLRQVIYVVPFTTIIEQNAQVFRRVFGGLQIDGAPDLVVEHHSNLDAGKESVTSRLAAENWDAPLVVTTSVQFYESLFARRTSRCRKLHRLADSVIVLDEAQALPVDYLKPCLTALQQLTANYGATVVLCTATQPAVEHREDFEIGLQGVREIIPEPEQLSVDLQRVTVEDIGPQTDAALAQAMQEREQVLCVVNTRSHAHKLFDALCDEPGHYHLSALMCPEHRTAVLAEIRRRLEAGQVCRVISTQLIEAGVDIDFPVVFRSLAGLDSLAQAAGRCNRSGTLPGKGEVYIFRAEHVRSEQYFAETANCAGELLPLYDDPLSLAALEHYFQLYYWNQKARWDAKLILHDFKLGKTKKLPFLFNFATVAKNFRLIENAGEPVIIPWGDRGYALCEELRSPWKVPNRTLLRKLQRYTVNVPQRIWNQHVGQEIQIVHEHYPVLVNPKSNYSERTGLTLGEDLATSLIV